MSLKVMIIMGSDSDFDVMKAAITELRAYGIESETHIASAHRTPAYAELLSEKAENDGFGVIICAAGMAAHLAGVIASHTSLPVIGVPIKSTLEGMDALLSTVMMPPGIPVATVGINNAKNAAILAAQILGVADGDLKQKLKKAKSDMADAVMKKDAAIQEKLKDLG
ncbi:MAG: 5-(carboxyamino)imidazole ribonucleotide mutase [Ruminococcus sp.]|jgi:5-(carboxyamino)imidazole ribonucleotide mutase|nr:5-(carboxyamino)imidazole ribonucleotide mutase [Ruminococcus sp.]